MEEDFKKEGIYDDTGQVYIIRSERDAFYVLEKALSGELEDIDSAYIRFSGWPKINIYLPNTPIEGSITPTMMEAFLDLQRSVYRTHSLIAYDSADLRNMTTLERDRLEFRVKVSEGSSDYLAELAKSSQAIVSSLVGKMSSAEVMVTTLSCALLVAGSVAWSKWLSSRITLRKAELDAKAATGKDQAALEESRRQLAERELTLVHDTRRFEILAQACRRIPVLDDVEEIADASRSSIIKAVSEEAGGRVQGIDFSTSFAQNITATKREQSKPATFVGVYRVSKVDATSLDGFRVTLSNIETDQEISASLQDALISEEHKALIQDAEWNKTPIRVKISARRLRNRVIDAVILNVEKNAPVE